MFSDIIELLEHDIYKHGKDQVQPKFHFRIQLEYAINYKQQILISKRTSTGTVAQ